MKKFFIEKELCHPTDAYHIPGPFYHVVSVDEETGEREVLKTFDNDVKEAAEFARRKLDFEVLQVAYQNDPHSFDSTGCFKTTSAIESCAPVIDVEQIEGEVSAIHCDYVAVRYVDSLGYPQLLYLKPGNYECGDKVEILVINKTKYNKNKNE
jgi:hypothetical protein